jgi:hypothetical protein
MVAAWLEMWPSWLGNPVRKFDTARIPTACGARPVSSAARVGEHSGRDVEVGELQAAGGEGVDVGGVDVGAVAAELGEAGVVEEDDHHVGGVVAGVGRLVEPRLGVGDGPADAPLEPLLPHRPPSSSRLGSPPCWTRPAPGSRSPPWSARPASGRLA